MDSGCCCGGGPGYPNTKYNYTDKRLYVSRHYMYLRTVGLMDELGDNWSPGRS